MQIGMYYITLLIWILIYAIAVMGLNITMGYAGQVNLGQAAFIGIGAFTSAILTMKFGISFWIALPLSGLISFIAGMLLGAISIRLKYDFLAMTTIGFNFIMVAIFLYYPIFGGSFGLLGVPRPRIFGYKLTGVTYLALVFVIFLICLLVNIWIERSWLGLAFEAIREDEDAAQTLGIDVKKFKVLAFAIGAGMAGIAGSLYAHFSMRVAYSDFTFAKSIELLSMCILGGLGTVYGPIIGTALVIILPEIFRPLRQYRLIMHTLILIILLRFQPQGLLGKGSYLETKIKKWIGGFQK